MSPSSARKGAASQKVQDLSYEAAFTELENIVAALEDEGRSLEESLNLYERGQALAAHCAALLEKAELKVRKLGDNDLTGTEG